MKNKVLIGLLSFFIIVSFVRAEEKDFGFTGEFVQIVLKSFPPFSEQQRFETEDVAPMTILAKRRVKALMIGITNFAKPENPNWEIFDFYSYHWPGYHDWWVGFIVVNYDDITVPCEITMQIKGPEKSKITRDAILQPNEAVIFSAKVILADKIGLYTLIGKIKERI